LIALVVSIFFWEILLGWIRLGVLLAWQFSSSLVADDAKNVLAVCFVLFVSWLFILALSVGDGYKWSSNHFGRWLGGCLSSTFCTCLRLVTNKNPDSSTCCYKYKQWWCCCHSALATIKPVVFVFFIVGQIRGMLSTWWYLPFPCQGV
jgi:hypothetical protein